MPMERIFFGVLSQDEMLAEYEKLQMVEIQILIVPQEDNQQQLDLIILTLITPILQSDPLL